MNIIHRLKIRNLSEERLCEQTDQIPNMGLGVGRKPQHYLLSPTEAKTKILDVGAGEIVQWVVLSLHVANQGSSLDLLFP